MSRTESSVNFQGVPTRHGHTKYLAGIIVGIIIALLVGLSVGYATGMDIASRNNAPSFYRNFSILVSGNVTVGSLGIPRAITFVPPSNDIRSSVTLPLGNGQYRYQVVIQWPQTYNVTIYYQDPQNSWQHCTADPRSIAAGSSTNADFRCRAS